MLHLTKTLFLAFSAGGTEVNKPHAAVALAVTLPALRSAPRNMVGCHGRCLCEVSSRQCESAPKSSSRRKDTRSTVYLVALFRIHQPY